MLTYFLLRSVCRAKPCHRYLGSRFVANLVFRSKQSLPYQREVWRDCQYGRGLFRETHKKRIALCYPSCVERKTRHEPALCASDFSRTYVYTPNPWKGRLGVALCEPSFPTVQNEKRACLTSFFVRQVFVLYWKVSIFVLRAVQLYRKLKEKK